MLPETELCQYCSHELYIATGEFDHNGQIYTHILKHCIQCGWHDAEATPVKDTSIDVEA